MGKLSQAMQDAINEQINRELYSAYLYLSMSAYCERANLSGSAHWMKTQSQEEVDHAMKFFDLLNKLCGQAQLKAIDQPPAEFESPTKAFELALQHEREISERINQLYELALKEKAYTTETLIQWFVGEQVEEENSVGQICEQLKMAEGDRAALLLIDRELAGRTE